MSTKNIHDGNLISSRLVKSRKYADLSQVNAAAEMGISPVTLNRYEKGHREPAINALVAMAKFYGVSQSWLLTGEGTMLENEGAVTIPPPKIDSAASSLPPETPNVGPAYAPSHPLRHAFAVRAVVAGVHLRILQAVLGHSSVKVTEIYTQMAASHIATEMAKW